MFEFTVARRVSFLVLFLFFALPPCFSKLPPTPKRCCSPDQWEADAKMIGTTLKLQDPQQKVCLVLFYSFIDSTCYVG